MDPQEILKEKGEITIAALSLNEFKSVFQYLMTNQSLVEDDEDLLTIDEIISKLRISKTTFYKERAKGKMPEHILGRRPMFKLSEVKKALKIKAPEFRIYN